jgi:hypothetical protein
MSQATTAELEALIGLGATPSTVPGDTADEEDEDQADSGSE